MRKKSWFVSIAIGLTLMVLLPRRGITQALQIVVTAPPPDSQVPERPIVEGTVTNPNAKVWVIVHPLEVSDYWVQPAVTVREDGHWRVQVVIGRPGQVDVGKYFEICAVANPKVTLQEGQVLTGWPDTQATSNLIDVRRR